MLHCCVQHCGQLARFNIDSRYVANKMHMHGHGGTELSKGVQSTLADSSSCNVANKVHTHEHGSTQLFSTSGLQDSRRQSALRGPQTRIAAWSCLGASGLHSWAPIMY